MSAPKPHPSHAFPTPEEHAANPMVEGCGFCACLPRDDEAARPCAPSKPFWTPARQAAYLAEQTLRSRLLGTMAARVEDRLRRDGVSEAIIAGVWRLAERQARGEDSPAAPPGPMTNADDLLRLVVGVFALGVADEPWTRLVDALARELAWARVHLRTLGEDVEQARVYRERKGGQQAGVPMLASAPPSLLNYLDREVRRALGGASQDVPLAEIVKAALGDGEPPPRQPTVDELLTKVRARLGPVSHGASLTISHTLHLGTSAIPATGVRWKRIYADGQCSDERYGYGETIAECLQKVLDHEDWADAKEPEHAGPPPADPVAEKAEPASEDDGADPLCVCGHPAHAHLLRCPRPNCSCESSAEPPATPADVEETRGVICNIVLIDCSSKWPKPSSLRALVAARIGARFDEQSYSEALASLKLTTPAWDLLVAIGNAGEGGYNLANPRGVVARRLRDDLCLIARRTQHHHAVVLTPAGRARLAMGRGPR